MARKVGPHTEYLNKALASRTIAPESDKSVQWIRDTVVKLAHGDGHLKNKNAPTSRRANKPEDKPTNRMRLGNMYLFVYDAKMKKELNYWDAFPLIFPISYTKEGFNGINLHYLPPQYRVWFLDKIVDILESRGTEVHKYRLTTGLINAVVKMKEFKPCIHQYLNNHVRSLFQPVPPEDWNYTVLLSSENFKKASKFQVWKDSLKKMGVRK